MNIMIVHSVDNAEKQLTVRVVLIVFGSMGGVCCLIMGPFFFLLVLHFIFINICGLGPEWESCSQRLCHWRKSKHLRWGSCCVKSYDWGSWRKSDNYDQRRSTLIQNVGDADVGLPVLHVGDTVKSFRYSYRAYDYGNANCFNCGEPRPPEEPNMNKQFRKCASDDESRYDNECYDILIKQLIGKQYVVAEVSDDGRYFRGTKTNAWAPAKNFKKVVFTLPISEEGGHFVAWASTKVDTDEEVRANPLKEKNSEEAKGMFVEMTTALPISEKGASILPMLIPLGLAKYAGQLIDEGFESASDLFLATEADLISIGMLHAEAQSLFTVICNVSHVLPATGAEGGTGVAVVAAGKAQSRAARLRQKSRAARIRQMREAKAATAAANAAGSGGGLARRDSLIIHGKVTSEV